MSTTRRSRKPSPDPQTDWPFYAQGPCPRCLQLAHDGAIQAEAVMPLPPSPFAPLAHDRSGPCCHDCAAADSLRGIMDMEFAALRLCTANERLEDLRRPRCMRADFGLFQRGMMRPHPFVLAVQLHHRWLATNVPAWFSFDHPSVHE